MSLRSKLIAATLLFTFVLVALLSTVFFVEVLRERVSQTQAINGELLHELLGTTQSALQVGLAQDVASIDSESAFRNAVAQALQRNASLQSSLNGLVRYSPDMQDAFVSDASSRVLVSTAPSQVGLPAPARRTFTGAHEATNGVLHLLFGAPEVLDVSLPLLRNGQPFLTAHLGLRSTFLRETYAPWLRTAGLVSLVAMVGSLLLAAVLSAAASRPIELIERRLADLSGPDEGELLSETNQDPLARVSSTISRLDAQMRNSEQTRSEMATNLNSMLYALKDAVMLFTPDWRLVTASDAVRNFLPDRQKAIPGTHIGLMFPESGVLGAMLSSAIQLRSVAVETVLELEDGRRVQLSLNRSPGEDTGVLLTLHDIAAEQEFGRELQLSQRLASVGRLMSGVGHEVKNPINAMVVHLELLRGKLEKEAAMQPAIRHVEVLSSEMRRLDRVVQTLADFSRPIEPVLQEQELLPVVQAVLNLIAEDASAQQIQLQLHCEPAASTALVRCDAELLRQAILNVAINAMQAMPKGGNLSMWLRRGRHMLELAIEDTGYGIPPETIQRIFDLYFTTKASGSGIGLSMTYRIVQIHGGTLQVQSEVSTEKRNSGSTFTIRLPMAPWVAQGAKA